MQVESVPHPNQQRPQDTRGQWDITLLEQHGEQLLWSGDRLSRSALYARYLLHKGPSPAIIEDHFGSLNSYYHHLGLVGETKGWNEEQYLEWFRGLEATGMKYSWNARDIDRLSGMRLGPSTRSIITKFESLNVLREKVAASETEFGERASAKARYRLHEMEIQDNGKPRRIVYSELLRLFSVDGADSISLSGGANALLALLLQNSTAPVFPADFFDRVGEDHEDDIRKAWQELKSISVINKFLFSYPNTEANAYALIFDEDGLELLTNRLAFIELYPQVNTSAENLKNKKLTIAAALGAATLIGGAIIGYRHHKNHK